MVPRMRLTYKTLLSISFLCLVIVLQDTQGATMHYSSPTGLCQHFNGNCSALLNSTEPRYINSSLGLKETDRVANALLDAVTRIYSDKVKDKRCKPILEKTVCFFVFPFCSPQETKLDYCREDCNHLFEICGGDLNQIVGAGKFILSGKLSSIVFRFDECKDLKSETETSGNTSCKHLPYIKIPPKMKESKTISKDVIIMIAVLVPVAVVILILCGFYHRRMSKKAKLHSIHYENGKEDSGIRRDKLSNVVSMRDRIREWKVAPSELIELVDICKSRGVLDIPVDNIEYLKDLGSGQYGLVFQGKVNEDIEGETSRIVAVKTLREGSSQDAIKEFCQEVNIMSTFSHPNVVKLIGVSLTGEPYCMIFEFVEFGDLASFLRNCDEMAEEANSAYPKLTVTDQLAMAVQIASGMKYISSIRCVHRDLAARNCLVGRGLVVKISDFGLSRDVYASEYYRMDKTRMLPVRWLPPEAFVDGKFTSYSDVYSYGVLLWEIFTFGKLPYEDHDNSKTMELILEGNLLSKPDGCPSPVYDIMVQCWPSDPEKRIAFPEIINELCSLDDFGQRFEAQEDQIIENFKTRSHSGASKMNNDSSLSFNNKSCNAINEQPINIERLPPQSITKKPGGHYAIPPNKRGHDGGVEIQNTSTEPPVDGRNKVEAPRAVHQFSPPPDKPRSHGDDDESAPIYGNVDVCDDNDGPLETYDVPPKHEDDEETYSVPPVPRHENDDTQPQETYDVPPLSNGVPDGPKETYEVPPKREDEPQETYDVPPKPKVYPDEPQETYDVPPGSMKRPLIECSDEQQETYDVPPKKQDDDIYQNSVQVKPKGGHYSVPQSPFLKRRNENNDSDSLPPPPQNARHSYENVDFDGNPLLTS